jgi:hypothetical protein
VADGTGAVIATRRVAGCMVAEPVPSRNANNSLVALCINFGPIELGLSKSDCPTRSCEGSTSLISFRTSQSIRRKAWLLVLG